MDPLDRIRLRVPAEDGPAGGELGLGRLGASEGQLGGSIPARVPAAASRAQAPSPGQGVCSGCDAGDNVRQVIARHRERTRFGAERLIGDRNALYTGLVASGIRPALVARARGAA
jgi:hypothetical protein